LLAHYAFDLKVDQNTISGLLEGQIVNQLLLIFSENYITGNFSSSSGEQVAFNWC
jgi:hypothetical protein